MIIAKHTVETYAKEHSIARQTALNRLSKLRKQRRVKVSGGGKQKRIYTLYTTPQQPTNGFFDLVNKYNEEQLAEDYHHYVHGNYTPEDAIIDGLLFGEIRKREAVKALLNHVTDWKRLFDKAKEHDLTNEVKELYKEARGERRVRSMPKRYR